VVITRFRNAIEQSEVLLARLARVSVDVMIVPDMADLQAPVQDVGRIGILPALTLASRPLTATQAALKRAEDLILSCLLATVVLPVAAVIAIAIKLDSPGPVLFGQWREGYHARRIKVWKFRTMYHEVRDENCTAQTSRQDKRVTRVGRILRRLSLDELPVRPLDAGTALRPAGSIAAWDFPTATACDRPRRRTAPSSLT